MSRISDNLNVIVSLIDGDERSSLLLLKNYKDSNQGGSVTFVNPLSIYESNKNSTYINDLSKHSLVYADGLLLSKFASYVQKKKVKRISFDGNSLAPIVFDYSKINKMSIYLVGGDDGVAKKAANILRNKLDIVIVGTRSGYFNNDLEFTKFIEEIENINPDIVIISMGVPMQEKLSVLLKVSNWVGVSFTCGGYFDQISEKGVKYYPDIVNKLGLRALYRLFKEPRRLSKRYTLYYLPYYKAAIRYIYLRIINRV